jgi:hypothetical protein
MVSWDDGDGVRILRQQYIQQQIQVLKIEIKRREVDGA